MADPALSLARARETWQKHGRSEKWFRQKVICPLPRRSWGRNKHMTGTRGDTWQTSAL